MHTLRLYLIAVVKDKHGRVVRVHRQRSRSFVKNFMEFLKGIMTAQQVAISTTLVSSPWSDAVNLATIIDESGAQQILQTKRCGPAGETVYLALLGVNAPQGDDTWGIVVGKGTTAPTPNDYALENKYPHGDGDGYLNYGATTISDITVSNKEVYFTITRVFTNNGSAKQTVTEAGVIARYAMGYYGLDQDIKFLIIRDILTSSLDIPAQGTCAIKYKVKIIT